jgi:RNA-binding protein YhbY
MSTQIKKETQTLEPAIRIGKNGLSPTVLEEIKKYIMKHKYIKVKILKSVSSQDEELKSQLEQHGYKIIRHVGNSLTIAHAKHL